MERFSKKIWLATATMHGEELEYIKEAYETGRGKIIIKSKSLHVKLNRINKLN